MTASTPGSAEQAVADPAGWDTEGIRPLLDETDRPVQALITDLADTPSIPETS